MRGCITVITVIVLMLQGNYWCLRNLWGTFELFSYERPEVLRRRLELAQRGPRAVRAVVQRVNSQIVKRLIGTLLKLAV
jgi:hypothetical protein